MRRNITAAKPSGGTNSCKRGFVAVELISGEAFTGWQGKTLSVLEGGGRPGGGQRTQGDDFADGGGDGARVLLRKALGGNQWLGNGWVDSPFDACHFLKPSLMQPVRPR